MNKPSVDLYTVDIFLKKLTGYHYFYYFLLFLSKIPIFWHALNLIFLSPFMDYTCRGSTEKNTCPCDDPVWDRSVFTETTQSRYGIYCDNSWLLSFSQSIIHVGMVPGSLIFGFLADRFGRLAMFCFSCLVLGVFGCLVSVMPTITTFIIMRCLEGVGLGGCIVTSYVLVVELCGPAQREIITSLYHIPINMGHISLAGVSYFLRNCNDFQLAISVPVLFFKLLYWICEESPKWLLDNHKVDRTVKTMEKIGRFNKKPIDVDTVRNEVEEYLAKKRTIKTEEKVQFWHIFRYKKLTRNFICIAVVYFVSGMGYYGVSQYIGNMSKNIHVNVAIAGALLIPATIASVFLLQMFGRKTFAIGTNFSSGILMIIVVCIPSHLSFVRVLFSCLCNCFYFMTLIVVFLFGVELFPTSIRNSVIGVLSVICRLGQISGPYTG